jgi:hypothetical protein
MTCPFGLFQPAQRVGCLGVTEHTGHCIAILCILDKGDAAHMHQQIPEA